MATSNPNTPGTGGGSVAIRGFLVQTLVALLEVVKPESSFTEITLEPAMGDDQFDFLWKNKDGSHATQVKSTVNSFTKADVEKWAAKLRKARTDEECTLTLVGNIPSGLVGSRAIAGVFIETKNLHLGDLVEQAAQRLAKFLESEQMPAGTALQREMVVHALTSRLEHLATKSEPLSRESFLGLLRQWINSAPKGYAQVDLSHFEVQKYAPAELVGRTNETALLDQAWLRVIREEKPRAHVWTFVALGGEGKTSLVAKWAAELAAQDWPGCDAAFAWSFYSQGTREQQAASSDLFLKAALTFFGDEKTANSAEHASEKGKKLAALVGQRRCLLILDGLEPLQYPTEAKAFKPGALKDDGIAKLLKGLAAASQGLCILTTRVGLPDLDAFKGSTVIEEKLERLSRQAGVDLLKRLGVKGNERRNIPLKDGDPDSEKVNEFEKLVEDVKGHALTLTLLGGFLKRAFHGDIRQRDRVKFEKADEKMDGGHAFRTMAAYEQWLLRDGGDEGRREVAVLRLMGLFDRPADAGCVAALRREPIPGLTEPLAKLADDDWEYCLSGLEAAKLLTVNRDASGALVSLDAHPLLREYFARQLRDQQPDAWRAAHRRLYEHLCATTPDKGEPTLEDLQPLYQAVAHGCQAGLQQETLDRVYRARILRGDEDYSARKLGAFGSNLGVIACFFELASWKLLSPELKESDQAWLLNRAAGILRALGRLTEALYPARRGVEKFVNEENWRHAAISSRNLVELELVIGACSQAENDSKLSIAYADKTDDTTWRINVRTARADVLHQTGRRSEAQRYFAKAEQMRASLEPDRPLLFMMWGFFYCDLLLADAERVAWQVILGGSGESSRNSLLESCHAVSRRATQTLDWARQVRKGSLLDIALDHLTLGRAALYAAIQENSDLRLLPSELSHIDAAVDGLRRAGQQDELPKGLLSRAWLRSLTGPRTGPESAQSDLDEAWEIAERGPMKLHMADIHLHRARLFRDKAELKRARTLIEQCGYWRRKEELEDAEEASKTWPAIIEIFSATYGAGDFPENVADFLRSEIAKGHRRIPVTNRLTGGKDPCEFSEKKLTVEFDRDGKRQRVVVTEKDELDLT